VARNWRDDRIEELEAIVRAQQATIVGLEQRIRDLEARLAKFSGTSSTPPSSDPPGAPPPARPRRTGRRRGGQPGHPKQERALVAPDQVTHVETVKPSTCRRCGKALAGHDAAPYRHHVIEVPKGTALVNEYRLHTLICSGCGTSTRASLPVGVPSGQFGPRLQAIVALCSGAYRMSKRSTKDLIEDFFGVAISLGSIANLEQATREALAAPVEEVAQAIQKEPVVHADETGWFEHSKRAWLWVAVTAQMAFFLLRTSRGAQVAQELLGAAFTGILISDRWSAYTWVDVTRRQLCWAHLLRQFRGFQDYGSEAARIGRALEVLTETMFHAWHRVRDGTMTRTAFQDLLHPLRQHVVARLDEGVSCTVGAVAGRCREILDLEPALWTFVQVEGVEPTNNAAERAVRQAVLWRKGSFGTDSPQGSRFVECILTVVTTLRLQKRNVLDYVTAACHAALQGQAPPPLLSA
jgi:transposase